MEKLLILTGLLLSSVFARIEPHDSTVTFYGLAQYRLRIDYTRVADTAQNSLSASEYSNRIGFYWGTIFKPTPDILLQFQFGNDWFSTEAVSYSGNNPATVSDKGYPPFSVPYFHLAFAQWNPGVFRFAAGKIHLQSFGPLDLIERSLAGGTYSEAAFISWSVATNNSLMGISAGMQLLQNSFNLGIDLFSTVIEPRRQDIVNNDGLTDNNPSNPAVVMTLADIPVSAGNLSLTPQISLIFNRNYNASRDRSDHEISAGFTVSYQISNSLSAYLYAAYARLSNVNSRNPLDSSSFFGSGTAPVYDQRGFITGAGTTVPLGPGKLIFEAKYSNAYNLRDNGSLSHYIFGDLKYAWKPGQYVTIMPRFRMFTTIFPLSKSNLKFSSLLRPELILTGQI